MREKSIHRRKPTRKPRASLLIVCEGEKTEPDYFRAMQRRLGLTSVEVGISGRPQGNAPISIVNSAIASKKLRASIAKRSPIHVEYDSVWCVVDVEAPHPHESIDRACEKAIRHGLKIAMSNPCFEYWYLLHFIKTSKAFSTNNDVIRDLKKYYLKYSKNNADIFDAIYPNTDKAIKYAKEILQETGCGDDARKHNSSTTVHKLVEILSRIATHS